jgi:hypothetical protein
MKQEDFRLDFEDPFGSFLYRRFVHLSLPIRYLEKRRLSGGSVIRSWHYGRETKPSIISSEITELRNVPIEQVSEEQISLLILKYSLI